MQYDIWAINPAPDDDILRANASIAGAGALTPEVMVDAAYGCWRVGLLSLSPHHDRR